MAERWYSKRELAAELHVSVRTTPGLVAIGTDHLHASRDTTLLSHRIPGVYRVVEMLDAGLLVTTLPEPRSRGRRRDGQPQPGGKDR